MALPLDRPVEVGLISELLDELEYHVLRTFPFQGLRHVERLRRLCRNMELLSWRTSPRFLRNR
jgi:hypothetical protein